MAFIRSFVRDLNTPLYRNAIYLLGSTIVAGVLGFVFWVVVARYYDSRDVGIAAAIIPLLVLIGLISRLGFEFGLIRFLPSSGKNSRAMINTCFTISGLTAVTVSLVFLVGLHIWSPELMFIRENPVYFFSVLLSSIAFSLFPLMNRVFVARRDARFHLAGTSIIGLKIPLSMLFAFFFGAFGIFASWSLALMIALLIGTVFLIPKVDPGYRPVPTFKKQVVSNILHFSSGNYIAAILGMLPTTVLPLMILHTYTPQNVAYYHITFTLAHLLIAVSSAVCLSLFAEGSHFEKELRKNAFKALKLIFVLLSPAALILILFGDHILLLFGAEYSAEGLALLQIFSVAHIFVAINSVFLATRRVLKRLKPILAISAFNAVVILGLAYMLLDLMGLVGVAFASLISRASVSAGIGVHLLKLSRQD